MQITFYSHFNLLFETLIIKPVSHNTRTICKKKLINVVLQILSNSANNFSVLPNQLKTKINY